MSQNDKNDDRSADRLRSIETSLRGFADNFTRIFTALENHAVTVGKLESIVTSQQGQIKSLDENLEKTVGLVNASRATDWRLVVAVLALVVTGFLGTCSLIMTIGVLVFAPMKEQVSKLESAFHEHDEKSGHPELVLAKVEHNAQKLQALDTNLQREMRLLIDTSNESIRRLDEKLQLEMKGSDAKQDVLIAEIRQRLDYKKEWIKSFEDRVTEHQKAQGGVDARQDEALRWLEGRGAKEQAP